jgi:hypothetical protein
MISDHVRHWRLVGCRSSVGSAVLPEVRAGVRAGVLLDQDPQPDLLLGLTVQLNGPISSARAAATDPFLGIPQWGGRACTGEAGDRGCPDD